MSALSLLPSTRVRLSATIEKANVVVLFTANDAPLPKAAEWLANNDAEGRITAVLDSIGNKGSRLELVGTQRVLLVNVGDSQLTTAALRDKSAQLVQTIRNIKDPKGNIGLTAIVSEDFGLSLRKVIIAMTYGLQTALYSYKVGQKSNEGLPTTIQIITPAAESYGSEIWGPLQEGVAADFQRELIDTPPNLLGVDGLVSAARRVASVLGDGIEVNILRGNDLAKFGLLNAVARASGASQKPAVVVLSYKGDPGNPAHTVLVGKGLVFDTGGINLKSDGGRGMKADMGGAAVALSAFYAIAATSTPANVSVVLGIVRNDIGPDAYAPDDVYTAYNGKTVEIGNTDAEGRLVLADCLAYAEANLKPTRIISIATLTGAKLVAVGEEYAAALSLNQEFADTFLRVARNSDELAWQLPLSDAVHGSSLNSKVADLVNIGAGRAGTCTAAYFLTRFVDKVPYLHLDVAGTVGPGKEAWGVRTLRALVNP